MTVLERSHRREFDIEGRTPGGHYSAAVTAGGLVFVAGQTPRDENRNVMGDTIEAQTEATLDNVERALAAAGATLNDIVKVTVYLTDLALFPRFNATYASRFVRVKPARTTVECGLQGVLIEIDVIARATDGLESNLPGWPFKVASAR